MASTGFTLGPVFSAQLRHAMQRQDMLSVAAGVLRRQDMLSQAAAVMRQQMKALQGTTQAPHGSLQ